MKSSEGSVRLASNALLLSLFVIRIYFAYSRARVPFEIDYEEGNILNAGLRLLHHQTPYPAPGSFPYIFNPYGPVGYWLTEWGIRFFGISLFGPRLFVLVSAVLVAWVVAALIKRLGHDMQIACTFGLYFLCSREVWRWLPLLRVDFWTILLSVSGLFVFVALKRFRCVSGIVFAAAILTKPTALAAPFACAIELVTEKKVRELCSFGALLLAPIGFCLLILGPSFRFNLLNTHPDPYTFRHALALYWIACQGLTFPAMIIVFGLFAGATRDKSTRLVWLYSAAATVTAFTAGKLGSETNHLLEWGAAVCLASGVTLCFLSKTENLLTKPLLWGTIALTSLFAIIPGLIFRPDLQRCEDAYRFVRTSTAKRILSEDTAALVLAGKPVLVSNPYVLTQLGDRIWWSNGSLGEMVRRKEFDLILLGNEVRESNPSVRWPTAVIEAVSQNYVLQREFYCTPSLLTAYVPRDSFASRESGTPRVAKR